MFPSVCCISLSFWLRRFLTNKLESVNSSCNRPQIHLEIIFNNELLLSFLSKMKFEKKFYPVFIFNGNS